MVKKKKRVTLDDIAALCGVSKATVSRVINRSDLVSENIARRVREALHEQGYHRTQPRLNLPMPIKKAIIIGDYDLNTPHSFFFSVLKDLNNYASNLGLSLELVFRTQLLGEDKKSILLKAQAVIVLGMDDEELLSVLRPEDLPVLIINGYDPQMQFLSVSPDYYLGGYLAARHLLDLGHTNIKCITANIKSTIVQRAEGFRSALIANGITNSDDYFIDLGALAKNITHTLGEPCNPGTDFGAHQFLPELIRNGTFSKVTAVFCICDMVAITLIESLNTQGISVPKDISVLGFDDINISELISPPLTTIRTDQKQLAKIAIHTLLQTISSNSTTVTRSCVPVSIVNRKSCKVEK
ncbi:LacI family DNA-binding transcriptional regulator [Psychromonas aquimarina]|uniref:LacI family DNA-binding transcriptional regulator n=1 Tax=Psychromonas aquimarina TaxID=444919 RepID=UPI0004216FB3|nr:LacI family DNA-binding transcriptional regulator [Psychromonas aquimarina]